MSVFHDAGCCFSPVSASFVQSVDSLNAQSAVRGCGLMQDKQMHREQNECSDPYNYCQHFKWAAAIVERKAKVLLKKTEHCLAPSKTSSELS
jgi:hypothetical protein